MGYRTADGQLGEVRLTWQVRQRPSLSAGAERDAKAAAPFAGLDLELDIVQRMRLAMFAPKVVEAARTAAAKVARGNTGAGGANVWAHHYFYSDILPGSVYQALPKGADMRVSIRRSLRVGRQRRLRTSALSPMSGTSLREMICWPTMSISSTRLAPCCRLFPDGR